MDSDNEEDYDYGSDESYGMESDAESMGFDPAEEIDTDRRAAYEVLNEAEIKERLNDALESVTSVTGLPADDAGRILRHFKWDGGRVTEEYFADMSGTREKMGLVDDTPDPVAAAAAAAATPSRKGKSRSKKVLCSICYEEFPAASMLAAPCHHYFCKDCWHGYASTAVEAGPSCLDLRCPQPDCSAAVPSQVLHEVLRPGATAKLNQFALRSFVEDNMQVCWCPAPGCAFAVQCNAELSGDPLDISCKCGDTFCFTCKEEAHRPVDCATVAKWLLKNSAESENLNWILANTKPCPKCRRPIEKNHGCMHMSCSQCRHEFCWLCLGSWKEHSDNTGGFYACNRYEQGKKQGKYTEEEARREHAKQSLERYMHYFQRFAENDKARKQAIQKMNEFASEKIEALSELTATPTSQLKLVTDAWAQVVDCRRILKWTYAYGYYTFEPDLDKPVAPQSAERQQFFEFTQGEAERFLEKLHKMVEQDLKAILEGPPKPEEWPKFRENLIGLTDVTKGHFDKLVTELEQGEEMHRKYTGPEVMDLTEETDSAAASPRKPVRKRSSKRTRADGGGSSSAAASAAAAQTPDPGGLEGLAGFWQCTACTFANENMTATACEICNTARA